MSDAEQRNLPPGAWAPATRLIRRAAGPVEQFMHVEASSGIVLMLAAAVALAWANSPWSDRYTWLWALELAVRIGPVEFARSLGWVVNDILMAIFFFVVGMEIRREIAFGQLAQWRRAALPCAAALGGMALPALLFIVTAQTPEARNGWGVPMATDIAFALGVLTLLGRRVPPVLRVLLLAVAVIDDLGAILVIAIFYSEGIAWAGIGIAAAGIAIIYAMQLGGVRRRALYAVPAVVVWIGAYAGGLHPTIAGVIVGLLTPVRAWLGAQGLVEEVQPRLESLDPGQSVSADLDRTVERARREARAPASALIDALHPWVAFVIMPLFALANAGVALGGITLDGSSWSVFAGVLVGLLIGKPVGVGLAIAIAVWAKVASLPADVGRREIGLLGVVAGIGFTMSLFIASLGFSDPALLDAAKLAVLVASVLAALAAFGVGRLLPQRPAGDG